MTWSDPSAVSPSYVWLSLFAAAFTAFPASAQGAADVAVETAAKPRPRVGLVLGGGGAKGAAHVGVLDVLDELRIPVDCIVGTSMGALVGGTYASGMSADELDRAFRSISWQDAIARRSLRAQVPMRRKLAGGTFSNSLEFGVRDGSLMAPSGLISSQNVDLTIQYLVGRSRGIADFDKLPIPFRAVATDMQSGEMVVLDSGDLALAMRASMAVPGVFSPVSMQGRILGDGGLTRNVPVDIARQTCADVVIAVAVPNPPPTTEELRSPLTLMSRTLDVLVGANERQQLDTLGPDDVKIVIDMGDIGSASFDRTNDAVPLGRAAALTHRAELERYAVPEAEYLAWRESTTRPGREEVTLAAVNLNGLERANPEFIRQTLALQAGDVVTPRQIADRATAVFALSDFERVAYTLSGDPAQPTLDMHLQEKSWGPHIVRFDLGLHLGTDTNTAFTLGGDYLQTWVNDRGGELHGSLRLGRTSGLEASFYQPLDAGAPLVRRTGRDRATLHRRPLRRRRDAARAISSARRWGYLDAGRVFGKTAELRAGIRARRRSRPTATSARRSCPAPCATTTAALAVRYTFDSRDRDALWTRGLITRMTYFHSADALGGDSDYDRFEGTRDHRLAVPSQRRLPAGKRWVVAGHVAAPVRPVHARRPGEPSRPEPR